MKRCPECGREYDNTMMFCLDDGAELLYGPASMDEPATAILSVPGAVATGFPSSESPTKPPINTTDQTAILPIGTGDIVPKSTGFDKRLLAVPLLLVIIVLGGLLGYKYFAPAKQINSIAVMPFVNESGNADVEYLSDGMTETLISSLSNIPNLSVKARSTVFYYKGKETTTKRIGEELKVQAVLLGRVSQRGDDLKLSLELVNTETQDVIWSDTYNRKQSDLVSLQSEIAKTVSDKLRLKLTTTEQKRVRKTSTSNSEAQQLYLKGRFYWYKRTAEAYKKAIEFFNEAIEKDPNYALAFAGLADCYSLGDYPLPPKEKYPLAKQAALKAIELDDTLAEPHAALGRVKQEYEWDRDGAEKEFKRAIELNPNSSLAHMRYAAFFTLLGKHDEAIAESKKALALDPLSPLINWDLAFSYYWARRYDDAIEQDQKTLEIDPNYLRSIYQIGLSYEQKGIFDKAFEQYLKTAAIEGGIAEIMAQKEAYATSGVRGYSRKRLDLEVAKTPSRTYTVAALYARLDEKQQAFEWLQKAIEERSSEVIYIKVSPAFDSIRSDPRFVDLMKHVGLMP